MELRWEDYFLRNNKKFHKFWNEYLSTPRDMLFILGKGFDPRMCVCLESTLSKGGSGLRDCMLINYVEGDNSPSKDFRHDVSDNMNNFNEIIKDKMTLIEKTIFVENDEGHRIGPLDAASIFKDASNFDKYTDIVVDISALPFSVYLPLLGKILFLLDKEKSENNRPPNLHVLVAENPSVDETIKKSGLSDKAEILYGFPGNLENISKEDEPTIWIPILGEGQEIQLQLINDKISPREICPVLPFPAVNPRRGDDLVLEYRKMLMGSLDVESKNIIYGSEQNPFELYRQIQRTIEHYRDALEPVGKCKFAISSLSSKLMSIGAFLVAYEEGISQQRDVGIVYVESKGYSMKKTRSHSDPTTHELFSLWIFGDCYDL